MSGHVSLVLLFYIIAMFFPTWHFCNMSLTISFENIPLCVSVFLAIAHRRRISFKYCMCETLQIYLPVRRLMGDERAGADTCPQMCVHCAVTRALEKISPILLKTLSLWSPPVFSASRPAIPEIRKGGEHARTCPCTSPLTSVKRLGNRSLTAY